MDPEDRDARPEARQEAREERRRARRGKPPTDLLFGLMIPVFVAALIFNRGEPLPGLATLMLAGLAAFLLLGNARSSANLRAVLRHREAQRVAAMIVPAMFLAGIFGGAVMMLFVLALAAVGLLMAAAQGERLNARFTPPEELEEAVPAAPVPQALPAQASGEKVEEIDLRALCRGLPASLSGQIVSTVEHLELVMAEAKRSGDTRRAYDARQGLHDYLPNTVGAWKALPDGQRDVGELERALTQVRQIAGPDDSGGQASRKAWETQRRFLEARAKGSEPQPE